MLAGRCGGAVGRADDLDLANVLPVGRPHDEAQAEARAAFGGDRIYLEKLIEGGRHIEIQVFGDRYGHAVHFGERDCTVQRNHQKLIEESPSPALSADLRATTCDAAARAAARIGYASAGTIEMLLDHGVLRFMEMNCRLQVEHTISEARSGKDLVVAQLEVAAGRALPWAQRDIVLGGHAIECRINAEDPANGFAPAPGTITAWQPPGGDVRVDTHVEAGYVVPPFYDSLLAKLIAGRTAIVIAHRLATVRMLDRILVFDNGEVVEEGRHDDLVRKMGGIYRRLFERQALGLLTGEDAELLDDVDDFTEAVS